MSVFVSLLVFFIRSGFIDLTMPLFLNSSGKI